MTKLAIVEEREEDKYDTFTAVKCWLCDSEQGKEIGQDVVEAEPQVRFDRLVCGVHCSSKGARSRHL